MSEASRCLQPHPSTFGAPCKRERGHGDLHDNGAGGWVASEGGCGCAYLNTLGGLVICLEHWQEVVDIAKTGSPEDHAALLAIADEAARNVWLGDNGEPRL